MGKRVLPTSTTKGRDNIKGSYDPNKRRTIMERFYDIEGTINLSQDPQYQDGAISPDFYELLKEFKNLVISQVTKKTNISYLHFGDGDYYFLTKQPIGSACPGKRALSTPYEQFDTTPFKEGVLLNDYICIELIPALRNHFHELYPERSVDFPLEFLYGLVCNRWFTRTFSGKIGVIGAGPKIELIKRLLQFKEYQEYLGLQHFSDYISIPQKFACDNLARVESIIARQLESATSDIFLYGIGHVKTGLAWRFKKYHNAVYIDVGAGIDCLAGIIDYERPYAAGWTNFRLKDFDYDSLDMMYFKERPSDIWLG